MDSILTYGRVEPGFAQATVYNDKVTSYRVGLDLDFQCRHDSFIKKGRAMYSFNKNSGFTLIELMVTITIIAILASVALPSYNAYVARSKIAEATSELSQWRNAVERYYQDNRTFTNVCANTGPTGTKYFTYTCVSAAETYTLTATGIAGQGMNGYVYTVNQNNEKATTSFANEAVAATCWLTKKGGC